MKKIYLMLFLIVAYVSTTFAQVNSYVFTGSSGTYTPITGTTITFAGTDDNSTGNLPIGFSFTYNGTVETVFAASTNGLLILGQTINGTGLSANTLAATRKAIAALWDDNEITGGNVQYLTSGVTPNRILTVQYTNLHVGDGGSQTNPTISMQILLYETTNRIQIIYGSTSAALAFTTASIGLGVTATNFISITPTSTTAPFATTSTSTSNNSISTAVNFPTGTTYTFIPPSCVAPGGLSNTAITTSSATHSWSAATPTPSAGYEWAVTTSATPPASGTSTTLLTANSTGLSASTNYYLHVRSACGSGTFSNWSTLLFVTNCAPSNIPYIMPISAVTTPALPLCTSIENIGGLPNTWISAGAASFGAAITSAYTMPVMAYIFNSTNPANDWLYTNALNLTMGTSYTLKFKYSNDLGTLYPEAMEVAYGTSNNAAAMTNPLANYPIISGATPNNASIIFTPTSSGVHYIGFHAYSDADQDVLILDDVEVILTPSCVEPSTITAAPVNTSLITINWSAIAGALGYEYVIDAFATDPIGAGTNTTSLTASVSGTYSVGSTFYAHVRTVCTGSTFSAWKTIAIVIPPACTSNLLPANMAINVPNPVPLSWTAVTGATSYNVFLSTDNGTTYTNVGNVTGTTADLTLVSSGTFFWYVQPSNGGVASGCQSTATSFTTIPAPVNDIPCGALTLVVDDATPLCTNTVGATANTGEPNNSASCSTPNNTVWYTFTPTVSGIHTITASVPSASTNGMAAWLYTYTATGTCPGALTFTAAGGVSCINAPSTATAGSSTTINTTSLTAGSMYYIYVDGVSGDNGDVCLQVASPALCPAPTVIATNTITATSANVTWTGTGTYILEYGVTGFTPGTTNTAGIGGTLINPATSPQALSSLTAGTGYSVFIRQDCTPSNGYSANSSIAFTTTPPPPTNDEATGAISLVVGAGCTGAPYSNTSATASATEVYPSCSGEKQTPVWFSFVAPTSGAVRVTSDIAGGSFTDSKLAIFSATNPADYTTFSIISCDDDGGSTVGSGFLSVVYATGLTAGTTYYVALDKYSSFTSAGTFCITVDELSNTMLATTNTCTSSYQTPVSNSATAYTGWIPLMDGTSKLVALVRKSSGTETSLFSPQQNINTAAVRTVLGVPYLNRNFRIASTETNVEVQFFFLLTELAAINAVDNTITLANLGGTKQVDAGNCENNYTGANGATVPFTQSSNLSVNGVGAITTTVASFSNFYLTKAGAVLPIAIESFKGSKQATGNLLDWKVTCTSASTVTITLERSADGRKFAVINSQTETAARCLQGFNYTDATPLAGANYYRLKITTPDGDFKYSKIVVILNKDRGFELISITPNPVKDAAILTLTSAKGGRIELSIMDVAGKVLTKKSVVVIAGNNPINMNFASLGAGTYSVVATSADGEVKTTRFVKF